VGAFDAVGRVTVGTLMMPRREDRSVLPTGLQRIDVVVERKNADIVIDARFTEKTRVNSTHDPAEILGDNSIELGRDCSHGKQTRRAECGRFVAVVVGSSTTYRHLV